ncbi:MAG: ABC transporter substrate-binding protein, partial [Acidobacteriota bacterium]
RGLTLAHLDLQTGDAGPRFELVVRDSTSDPARAASALEALYADGLPLAIGGVTSAEALAMAPVVGRQRAALLSPTASSPDLAADNDRAASRLFRLYPPDDREAAAMAAFASQTLGVTTLVMIAEEQPYATPLRSAFRDAFTRFGGRIVATLSFPIDDASAAVDAAARTVETLAPEAVYLAGYAPRLGALVARLRADGFAGRILTTHAFATAAGRAAAGGAASGVILTQSPFQPAGVRPPTATVVTAYRDRFGEPPDVFAAYGYDALQVAAAALDASRRPSSGSVLRALRNLPTLAGVTGPLRFDDQGVTTAFPRIYVIDDSGQLSDYDQQVRAQRAALLDRMRAVQTPDDEPLPTAAATDSTSDETADEPDARATTSDIQTTGDAPAPAGDDAPTNSDEPVRLLFSIPCFCAPSSATTAFC